MLEQYLFDGWASGATIVPVQVDDSTSDGSYLYGKSLLLNLEVKIHKSAREGDPTMQNIGYYIKYLPSRIDGSMPCYLLDICGPLLSVFGVINLGDEAVVCEPLVASLPLLYFDTPLLTSLARVYGNKQVVTSDVTRFTFPYKDTALIDGEEVKLTYEAAIVRYVFCARLAPSQTKVIVKFARQYGSDVHQYCANEGFAPKLLSHEVLVNNWAFVVIA
ncbi:hypothetical protein PHYSODRAFT_341487 [Phytophthora sojae]|uniref:Uncharacterized protein n=1 Tax=Phytophthora sojae (strain P6497) TaxID=1094619 RepID=G5ADE3_PHYSP|nr:hypothetical protein PHYSODRAFT_341487 [Phytophthora sojae]EGZ06196.1 hypothetical protein PHYSODRAFT_341487 [Phytophthora sojae]|eukprot:XP_009538093.1 hypothetical protein PHYSODRAFT_341487 [Phytophthora sojae]